jgi:hypothetical protein
VPPWPPGTAENDAEAIPPQHPNVEKVVSELLKGVRGRDPATKLKLSILTIFPDLPARGVADQMTPGSRSDDAGRLAYLYHISLGACEIFWKSS